MYLLKVWLKWIDIDPLRILTDGVEGIQRNPLLKLLGDRDRLNDPIERC